MSEYTLSLWFPPNLRMPRMCSISSRHSNCSMEVVAGNPEVTSISLTLPTSKPPSLIIHRLTNGLYFWGSSNLLTKDHTYSLSKQIDVMSLFLLLLLSLYLFSQIVWYWLVLSSNFAFDANRQNGWPNFSTHYQIANQNNEHFVDNECIKAHNLRYFSKNNYSQHSQ